MKIARTLVAVAVFALVAQGAMGTTYDTVPITFNSIGADGTGHSDPCQGPYDIAQFTEVANTITLYANVWSAPVTINGLIFEAGVTGGWTGTQVWDVSRGITVDGQLGTISQMMNAEIGVQYAPGDRLILLDGPATAFTFPYYTIQVKALGLTTAYNSIEGPPGQYYEVQGQFLLTPTGTGGETVVPEPVTMLTAFLAIGSLGAYVRKHTRRPAAVA